MQRLKQRADFLAAATGAKAPGAAFVLQARKRSEIGAETGPVRVGFTVSKKVGNAVVRNRARRRLRAAAASVLPLKAEPAHDYVLIARAGTLKRRFADLVADLEAGLKRLGLYRRDAEAMATNETPGSSHAA